MLSYRNTLLFLSLAVIPIVPPAGLLLLILSLPPVPLFPPAELSPADPIIGSPDHPSTPYLRPPVLWSDPLPIPTREEYEEIR